MNWNVTIRSQAKADIRRAYDWYEEQRAGLGDEFLVDQSEALLRLEADPERCPIYYRGFRRILAHRFPYKLFFRIKGREIIVFRILHGAQDHARKLNQ
ncbi:MAG TPA: type II toxin-antitoxin system RelE/ParE family toxin [Verrucomicrobiae bacterium]|nr:type II toxin-antitoxin system RelE/ParE family toxin [Verrucomicrobiae bacterium]